MKNNIALAAFFLFFSCLASGQGLFPIDTNKYSIHLPDYWRPGNKIWKILTDKLPLVCEQLKEKELCGDYCHPAYTIEFEMTEPFINNYYPNHVLSASTSQTWDFITVYSFECSLLLFNEKDKLLTRFILVDTDETWTLTNRASLPSYIPITQPKIYVGSNLIRQTTAASISMEQQARGLGGTEGQTPYDFINRNKEALAPARKDLLAVVDKKIRSL